jgi:F0F1-type ATP synthase membrane subunit c/vacuolar-type H+-ATPase subunit K
MRDMLNKSLETLIWIATSLMIVGSCYSGALIIRISGAPGIDAVADSGWLMVFGFLLIIFGVTMSFVFAGLCFQLMDIRTFTKHTAFALRSPQKK